MCNITSGYLILNIFIIITQTHSKCLVNSDLSLLLRFPVGTVLSLCLNVYQQAAIVLLESFTSYDIYKCVDAFSRSDVSLYSSFMETILKMFNLKLSEKYLLEIIQSLKRFAAISALSMPESL